MSKRKINIVFYLVFIAIIILIIYLILVMYNPINIYKDFGIKYGIAFPKDFKEEYYLDNTSDSQEEVERYYIFSGNNLPLSFTDMSNLSIEGRVKKFFKSSKIPKDKQIDFSHEYAWIDLAEKNSNRNFIYCIYDKEVDKYYFYEYSI